MFFNLIYTVALVIAAPVVIYRRVRHGRYRRGQRQKLFGLSRDRAESIAGGRACRWVHAVSVGEVQLLPDVVARLRRSDPETPVAISVSTDTGYDLARRHFGDAVFFCPLDFTWAVRRTLDNLRCKELILVELELWPNLIAAASRRGNVRVINARLSRRSFSGYRRLGRLLAATFGRIDAVACQDDPSGRRFEDLGVAPERISVTGSIKFDNAPRDRSAVPVMALVDWAGAASHRTWVLGSSGPGEEAMVLAIYRRLVDEFSDLRLVIVPRHPPRFDGVASLINDAGLRCVRRSVCEGQTAWPPENVVLVDRIGELRDWWGLATIATVGGTFGDRGGQNMIEPAGYGAAVSFGPDTRNFRVIADAMIKADAAVRVGDAGELERFVSRMLGDRDDADRMGRRAIALVDRHRGAIDRTMAVLCPNDAADNPNIEPPGDQPPGDQPRGVRAAA